MKKQITWRVEKRRIDELQPHPKNPRNFTEKGMKDLENSIKSVGFFQPIVANTDGTIISGHARTLKLKELGETEVDVYVPDRKLTEKQEEEILIRANANTAGTWDFEKLANEFELPELTEWGLELPEIEKIEPEETINDDEVPEEPVKAITVKGDLYELGSHRLLCGDSTMIDEVERLTDGQKIDMVFTDPPYGIDYDDNMWDGIRGYDIKSKKMGKIKGDSEDYDPSFLLSFFKNVKEIFVWGFQYYPEKLGRGGVVAWIKKTDAQKNMLYGDFELCWSKQERNKMFLHPWGGFLNKDRGEKERFHPTQKPSALIELFFEAWGKDKKNVIDLFGGSGSTLIACEKTDRRCFVMELDEKYCDVIVKRYIQFCKSNNKVPIVKRNGKDCLKEFEND